jgi:hypothetical protein
MARKYITRGGEARKTGLKTGLSTNLRREVGLEAVDNLNAGVIASFNAV